MSGEGISATDSGMGNRLRWAPAGAVVVAFLAVTWPLWSNAYLSPPDSASYFAVPRTLTIDRNLDFTEDYAALDFEKYLVYLTPLGRISNDWPAGSGIVWMPAYATAHALAVAARAAGVESSLVQPEAGTSGLYKLAVTLFVAVLGGLALALGCRLAEESSGRGAALGATFAVLLGTPVGFYYYAYGLMSHVTSMAAVGLLFWGWHRTRGERGAAAWFALGVLAGTMTMIRPQNVAFLAIFPLEALLEWPRVRAEAGRWARGVGLAAAGALIAFSPQTILWAAIYGHPLQLPKIEEMHWLAPRLIDVLFSDYHGLLSWSPAIALMLPGVGFLWRRDPTMAAAVGTTFLLQLYLNAANEIWWAGGSFGNRRFVNCGVPMIIGIAAALRGLPGWFGAPAATLLAGWNLLLMARERAGLMTLDHYQPWTWDFAQETLRMAAPWRIFPAMMGDLSGFGWATRGLLIAAGLALAAWLWRAEARGVRYPRLRRGVIGAACAWFLAAPMLVALAWANTEWTDHAQYNADLPARNQSLFNGYYEYGYYLLVKGRVEEAIEAYEKAAALRPDYANPHRYLGVAYLEMGRPEQALEHTGRALDLRPDYGQALETERQAIAQILAREPGRVDLVVRLIRRFEAAGQEAAAADLRRQLEANLRRGRE